MTKYSISGVDDSANLFIRLHHLTSTWAYLEYITWPREEIIQEERSSCLNLVWNIRS